MAGVEVPEPLPRVAQGSDPRGQLAVDLVHCTAEALAGHSAEPGRWRPPRCEVQTHGRDSTCGHACPVGADNPVTSCDLHVFVDEAAEPVSS